MNHWNLFKQTWRLFWRNPALWIFGLLSALGGGFNWNYGTNFDVSSYRNLQGVPTMPFEARAILREIFSSSTITTLFVIGLVWAIIAFFLATLAQGAMIHMVSDIDGGRKPGVGDGFRASARRFLPLLAVRFTLALPTLAIGLVAAGMALSTVSSLLNETRPSLTNLQGLGITAALGTISFLLGLLMAGIGVSAERAVVLEDQPIMPSLVQGWKLLWNKLGDYLVIVVLFIAVGIAAGLVFACILVPILCATIGTGIGAALSVERGNPLLITTLIAGPTLIVTVLLGLIFGTLATVFTSGVWTLAYRQWRADFFQPQTPATGLQPIEPIPSIEPLTPAGPNGPPPGASA
jgi:hypothetical protein